MTVAIQTARELLDFGARIGQGPRADEQLAGAVAIHNILQEHRVAYLADEVGMGKTYVALGAVALFRHFQPDFRLLVIAPRENIQQKWMKELRNFAAQNVRFADLRTRSIDDRPARPLIACGNLLDFVREVVTDPRRDFFLRLSSFSLAVKNDSESWKRLRDRFRQILPWLPDEYFDLRSKEVFKDNFARGICCALPVFDLVIVDEGHNLKHGFKASSAARNRILALAFGHPSEKVTGRGLAGYGPRAKHVLFLSATPLEESYRHVWNQLDVFGLAGKFSELDRDDLPEEVRKATAAKFLIRRVTSIPVDGRGLTKNQYRREWRRGGVHVHDDPIRVDDDRQRLVVALVQKKVAELLGTERFNRSFQVGMLASFESFLETAKLKRDDEIESIFDDADQTESVEERLGIDVNDINLLTRNYRKTFGEEMPHPKMDAVVESLKDAWTTGTKALIFVRRVASVKELKQKLDERYDAWLIEHLRRELPESVRGQFEEAVERYRSEKQEIAEKRGSRGNGSGNGGRAGSEDPDDDHGGTDTFFAWFFRGEGPKNLVSGANVQGRFIQRGAAYATFFEDNYLAGILEVPPGQVRGKLSDVTGFDAETLRDKLLKCAATYLSRAKKHPGADRMDAAQAAALELLKDRSDDLGERAWAVWHQHFEPLKRKPHAVEAPDVSDWLEQETFFTILREERWRDLRTALWPEPKPGDPVARFRERELRAQLLATAARLGHSLIDLYILTIQRLGSLSLRAREARAEEEGSEGLDRRRIEEYLERLDQQRRTPLAERSWGAYDELAEISRHFDLIVDVNAPDARETPLPETARYFGSLLRQQQPVGGMSGQVNKTLVQQFRMPGYPFVLVSTDLLQEGEDLHTFCSSVYHYGISWTPSSMEQRIGRIDRVRSQTDRRLTVLGRQPIGGDLLQVFFPFLEDTVELLQVQRVLDRMNTFLRLMHEGLAPPKWDTKRLDVGREIIRDRPEIELITETLKSAFPVQEWALRGEKATLRLERSASEEAAKRFGRLRSNSYAGLEIDWELRVGQGPHIGTARLTGGRKQPFRLSLRSEEERLVARCESPIGRVSFDEAESILERLAEVTAGNRISLGIARGRGDDEEYFLTAQREVLLGRPEDDAARVGILLRSVTEQADLVERECLTPGDRLLDELEPMLREGGDDE